MFCSFTTQTEGELHFTPPRGGAALLLFSPKFHFLSEAFRPREESAGNASGSFTFFARPEGLAQKVKSFSEDPLHNEAVGSGRRTWLCQAQAHPERAQRWLSSRVR